MDGFEQFPKIVIFPGQQDECLSLSSALLNLVLWLLRIVSASFERLESARDSKIDTANYEKALKLLQYFVELDFTMALLHVGKAEEKDTHGKIVATCKQVCEIEFSDRNKFKSNFFYHFSFQTSASKATSTAPTPHH